MKMVKGVVYEITDHAMDFFIGHNRVEYHSTINREFDGKAMHICIIRQADDDIETYQFFDEEIKCVSQVQEI
ncbi:hypothetical protein [Flyfo podovirus Tbat2_2]|nr:hypothetical protein [Flyfo podovirus Tbat2_2]